MAGQESHWCHDLERDLLAVDLGAARISLHFKPAEALFSLEPMVGSPETMATATSWPE